MLPFRGDDGEHECFCLCNGGDLQMKIVFIILMFIIMFISGIFEDEFIEERRQGLEAFVNR
jgi:hypothetical protein